MRLCLSDGKKKKKKAGEKKIGWAGIGNLTKMLSTRFMNVKPNVTKDGVK